MEILITYGHREEDLASLPIRDLALFVLEREGKPINTEVSISFVDDTAMAELNERFRGMEGPTDVLSFECDNIDDDITAADGPSCPVYELGDIIVAPDVAARQSTEFGNSFEQEVSLLIVHGLLHLCGYDHIVDEEAEVMEARERELLTAWTATCPLSPRTAERLRGSPLAGDDKMRPLVRRAGESRRCGEGRFPLVCAFRCAAAGVAYAFRSQRNLKIQVVLGLAAVAAGFALGISRVDWLAIVLCIIVVSVAEVVNTAIESAVDLASPEWHELARAAKDAAAGAVLLASAGSVIVGLIVFSPYVLDLL